MSIEMGDMDDETNNLLLIIKALAQKVDELTDDVWIYEASVKEVISVDRILKVAYEAEKKYGSPPPQPDNE
jgi:hypothetical protein